MGEVRDTLDRIKRIKLILSPVRYLNPVFYLPAGISRWQQLWSKKSDAAPWSHAGMPVASGTMELFLQSRCKVCVAADNLFFSPKAQFFNPQTKNFL